MRSYHFTHAITRLPAPSILDGLRAVDTGAPDLARMLQHHADYAPALAERPGQGYSTARLSRAIRLTLSGLAVPARGGDHAIQARQAVFGQARRNGPAFGRFIPRFARDFWRG
ncbi:MAG: hypothetical protein U5N55_07380 [Cypionkella sp.]|nr:hypothetical protein [Cypionkella sp.]